jgi:hypothetical protein
VNHSRTNKDGSQVASVQLAHTRSDPTTHTPKAEILSNFGRREEGDIEALRRLVRSITRFLGPEDELKAATSAVEGEPVRFIESRPAGAAWLLRGAGAERSGHAHGRCRRTRRP